MGKCLVLLNHRLTAEQEEDLRHRGYSPEYPPEEIQKLWGQVPTTSTGHEEVASLVVSYVNEVAPKAAIVQGEMGTTFRVVSALKSQFQVLCFHAVSRRDVVEFQKDGSVEKKAVFRHVMWREY